MYRKSQTANYKLQTDNCKVLIRSVNWLGDVVMSLPAIKKNHEQGFITDVLCFDFLSPIYESCGFITNVITMKKKKGFLGVKERFQTAEKIKGQYSSCYVLPNSFDSALIPFFAGISERIGFGANFRSMLLTKKIQAPKDYFEKHHSNHYLNIFGFTDEEIVLNRPLLSMSQEDQNNCLKRLQQTISGITSKKVIALCPGALYGPAKQWPVQHFIEAAKQIENQEGVCFLILGTQNDQLTGNLIQKELKSCINLCGQTSLKEFMVCLSLSHCVICNDSGAMHVAGALMIPTIAIFGSTSPLATKGLGPVHVIQENVDCSPCFQRECQKGYICLKSIRPEKVVQMTLDCLHNKPQNEDNFKN